MERVTREDLNRAKETQKLQGRRTIASHVLATWGDRAGFLSATAFAGGGAYLLYDNMKKLFPNPVYAEEGYYANAVGFLMMLGGATNTR